MAFSKFLAPTKESCDDHLPTWGRYQAEARERQMGSKTRIFILPEELLKHCRYKQKHEEEKIWEISFYKISE